LKHSERINNNSLGLLQYLFLYLFSMAKNRKFETLEDFLKNLHREGIALIDFNGQKIPCILINPNRFQEIMSSTYGKKLAVDTLLNVFHDSQDVFVDVKLNFLNMGIEENYLLYANDTLEFFESLTRTGIIGIASNASYPQNTSNIFMIQLPKKEAAENALRIIKANAKNTRRYTDESRYI
jgi:hypothetical protein